MRKLPPKVHLKGPSLYYVHKNRWIRLCRADAPDHELHAALWREMRRGVDTLNDVMDSFKSHALPELAISTQPDYEGIIEGHLRDFCGHMRPDELTSQDVAVYLEDWRQAGRGPRGNKIVAVLSSIYVHGMRIRACKTNPCYGVRRNKEKARTYYVDDPALRSGLRHAPPGYRHLLWAAYLTGFRQKDLRDVDKHKDILPAGIRVRQSKDGKHEIRLWTDSLRKVVRRALARSRCNYLFTNERGQHWSMSAVQSARRRLRAKDQERWRFHDLRAKADSDHETGLGLMRRYNRARKLRAVK